jgi:hypothetical protein
MLSGVGPWGIWVTVESTGTSTCVGEAGPGLKISGGWWSSSKSLLSLSMTSSLYIMTSRTDSPCTGLTPTPLETGSTDRLRIAAPLSSSTK